MVNDEGERVEVGQGVVDGLTADAARWMGAADGGAVTVTLRCVPSGCVLTLHGVPSESMSYEKDAKRAYRWSSVWLWTLLAPLALGLVVFLAVLVWLF